MHLNPAQAEAVTNSGIQLIIAGPGSGKTRVIVEKILHLLAQGAAQKEILALTFSEKAARNNPILLTIGEKRVFYSKSI